VTNKVREFYDLTRRNNNDRFRILIDLRGKHRWSHSRPCLFPPYVPRRKLTRFLLHARVEQYTSRKICIARPVDDALCPNSGRLSDNVARAGTRGIFVSLPLIFNRHIVVVLYTRPGSDRYNGNELRRRLKHKKSPC